MLKCNNGNYCVIEKSINNRLKTTNCKKSPISATKRNHLRLCDF